MKITRRFTSWLLRGPYDNLKTNNLQMKKIILFTVSIALTISTYSQSIIGGYGGYSKTTFFDSRDYNGKIDNTESFVFGFLYKDRTNQLINLTASIQYLDRKAVGSSYSGGHGGGNGSHFEISYKSIQAKIAPEIKIGKKHYFHFSAGIYFEIIPYSYSKGSSYSWQMGYGNTPYKSWSQDYNGKNIWNFIQPLSLGSCLSLSFEYPLGKQFKFLSEFNFYRGYAVINGKNVYGAFKNNIYVGSLGVAYSLNTFNISSHIKKFFEENENLPQNRD